MILGIIISGLVFITLDWMLSWLTKEDKPLYSVLDRLMQKLSRNNSWLYFLIPFGLGMIAFYVSTQFPDKSAPALITSFIGYILVGYVASDWVRGLL